MPSVSRVAAEIELRLKDDQFRQAAERMTRTAGGLLVPYDALARSAPQAGAGIAKFTEQMGLGESVLENTSLRLSDLARQLSGMVQLQQRFAGAKRNADTPFTRDLDQMVQDRMNPQQQSSLQLEESLSRQRQLMEGLRGEHNQVSGQIARETGLLERQEVLTQRLKELRREYKTFVDRESTAALQNLATQERIKAAIEQTPSSALRLADANERSAGIQQRAADTEKEILRLAEAIRRQRESEAKAAADALAARNKLIERAGAAASESNMRRTEQDAAFAKASEERTLRSSEEIRAQQSRITAEIERRRGLVDSLLSRQRELADLGQKNERLESRRADMEQKIGSLQQDRIRGAKELADAVQREAREAEQRDQRFRAEEEARLNLIARAEKARTDAAARARADDQAFNSAAAGKQELSSSVLAEQQRRVTAEIERRRGIVQNLITQQENLAAIGRQDEAGEGRRVQVEQSLSDLQRKRLQITKDLADATAREAREAEKIAQAREALIGNAASARSDFGSRTADQDSAFSEAGIERQVRGTAEIAEQQAKINAQIEKRRGLVDRLLTRQQELAEIGQRSERLENRRSDIEQEIAALQQKRIRGAKELAEATQLEERSAANLENLMASLGDKTSVRKLVEDQMLRNQQTFERLLMERIRLGKISIEDAKKLRTEFEKVNNAANVTRQISAGGTYNRFGNAVQQLSFALDDFANSTGKVSDRLRGVSNNLQVALLGLGPYGALVGVAIGLGVQWIAKLYEQKTAVDDLDESVRDLITTYDLLAETRERQLRQSRRLTEISNIQEVGRALEELKRTEQDLADQRIKTEQARGDLRKRQLPTEIKRLTAELEELDAEFNRVTTRQGGALGGPQEAQLAEQRRQAGEAVLEERRRVAAELDARRAELKALVTDLTPEQNKVNQALQREADLRDQILNLRRKEVMLRQEELRQIGDKIRANEQQIAGIRGDEQALTVAEQLLQKRHQIEQVEARIAQLDQQYIRQQMRGAAGLQERRDLESTFLRTQEELISLVKQEADLRKQQAREQEEAERRIRDQRLMGLREERDELQQRRSELMDQLRMAEAGPLNQLTVRGSAEAQTLIAQAGAEGRTRNEQKPIIDELITVGNKIGDVENAIRDTAQPNVAQQVNF